ncbi:hypothetical protein C8R44DRAFT_759549, partial [Mycena epipterygia]
MSIALTFADKNLLDSPLVGAEGTVHYSTSTTSGFRGRKLTTVMAASGLAGVIDWRKKIFVIDGVQRGWDTLKSRSGGIFSSEREWNWGSRPYHLKYHDSQKELRPNRISEMPQALCASRHIGLTSFMTMSPPRSISRTRCRTNSSECSFSWLCSKPRSTDKIARDGQGQTKETSPCRETPDSRESPPYRRQEHLAR